MTDDLEMQVNKFDEITPLHQEDNEPSYQDQLLSALFNKDIDHFKYVLSSGKVNADYYYTDPKDGVQKTCIDMACSEPGYSEYVELLLIHGANVNRYNRFLEKVPLFLATETGDIGTLRALLSHSKLRVNNVINKKTALNLACDELNSIKKPRKTFEIQKYEKIIEMLTKAKAKEFNENMNNSSHEMGIANLMINTNLIQRIQIDMLSLKPSIERDNLIFLLENNEKAFVNKFGEYVKNEDLEKKFSLPEEKYALLEKACEKGLAQAVNIIIKHQCSGTSTSLVKNNHKNIGDLAAIACRKGNHEILKIFLETNTRFTVKSESLLQITIKAKHQNNDIDESNYNECIKLLLSDERELLNINYLDFLHDTALHHAVRYGDEETAMMLLRKGATINILNVFDEFPVSKISSELLHQFFDECVKLKTNNRLFQEEDEEIVFDYRFLVPLNRSKSENFIEKPRKINDISQECFVPETEVLLYMSEQSRLRKLLEHPLITCFLFLKWQRIRYFHWLNTAFFVMFYLSIMSQAILGTQSEHIYWVHISTQILLGILTFRETIQFLISPKSYFFEKENWLEIFLIITSWTAIYGTEDHKRQLLSVAIMLSSIELFFMVGRYPRWSLYVEILRTVTINFLKFFLWYSLVIIAFALCFYILFKSDEYKKNITNIAFNISQDDNTTRPFFSIVLQVKKTEDEDPDLFSGPGLAIFKTIVMLTSEYDASSINFDQYPLVSYSMFVIFIFTISIVLLNLLNGLAVSDIQKITAEAQLWSYIYQIQMISYFERCFLGKNRLKLRIPGSLEWIHHKIRVIIGKLFFKRVQSTMCRFPGYEPNLLISVKLDGSIDIVMNKIMTNKQNKSKYICFNKLRMYFSSRFKKIFKSSTKQNILNSARAIIDEKLKEVDVQNKIKNKLIVLEENFNDMNKKIETISIISKKLENVLNFTSNKLETLENRAIISEGKLSDTCQHMKDLIYKFDSSLSIIKTVKSRKRSLSE